MKKKEETNRPTILWAQAVFRSPIIEKKGKYGKKKSRVSNPAGRVSLCSPIEYVFDYPAWWPASPESGCEANLIIGRKELGTG